MSSQIDNLPFQSAVYDGLEHNPRIHVVHDLVFGGPACEPMIDRRCYFTTEALQELLRLARQSPQGQVVLHRAGVRIRRVKIDATNTVDVLTIVAGEVQPEPFSLAGGR